MGRPGYSRLKLPVGDVKTTIFGHAEFIALNAAITALFEKWKTANIPRLKGIAPHAHSKALIRSLSEELLETFRAAPLVDPYVGAACHVTTCYDCPVFWRIELGFYT